MKLADVEVASKSVKLLEGDWPVSFEAVRLEQHLRFRALPAREKIQVMENMAELVKHVHGVRRRAGEPACPCSIPGPEKS